MSVVGIYLIQRSETYEGIGTVYATPFLQEAEKAYVLACFLWGEDSVRLVQIVVSVDRPKDLVDWAYDESLLRERLDAHRDV